MYKAICVTATDTNAGKTYIACSLIRALKKQGITVGVMKPVASGSRSDARELLKAAGIDEKIEKVNPLYFKHPLAPWVSSAFSRNKVHRGLIHKYLKYFLKKYNCTVVEGIGGLMVPITEKYFVIDMIQELSLPVLVVARPGLGTINHTLLTIHRLQAAKIKILGIIISGRKKMNLAEMTNPGAIEKLTGLPVIEVAHNKDLDIQHLVRLGLYSARQ